MNSPKRPRARLDPLLPKLAAIFARELKAGTGGKGRGSLEARGVNKDVELVLVALEDHAFLRDLLDALPVRVHQRHVVAVERREKFVVLQ